MKLSGKSDEQRQAAGPAIMKDKKSVLRSFNYAWEGLAFSFATQRHMRVHFAIMLLVLVAAWGLKVTQAELLQLLLAMVLVLMAEMVNTAVEYTIDLSTDGYDPRAKVAKDVAAGAVLLAAAYSVVVAVLVFSANPRLIELARHLPAQREWRPITVIQLVVLGILFLSVLITYVKKATKRGTLWRGGMISGHTAFGFLIATTIAIVTHDLAVTTLALALALLVSQSRIQARIHSPLEVLIGGALGIIVAFVLFMWPGS